MSGMTPQETNRERLARRAAEIRAGQAGEQLAGIADEIRDALALHDSKFDALFGLMRETVEAAGLAPAESRPSLRLIRGGPETGDKGRAGGAGAELMERGSHG